MTLSGGIRAARSELVMKISETRNAIDWLARDHHIGSLSYVERSDAIVERLEATLELALDHAALAHGAAAEHHAGPARHRFEKARRQWTNS